MVESTGRRRKREGSTCGPKADVEGHVEVSITGGEVKTGLTTKGPDREQLCQGDSQKLGVDSSCHPY